MKIALTVLAIGTAVPRLMGQGVDTDSVVTELELVTEEFQEPEVPLDENDPVRFTWTSSVRNTLERKAGFAVADSTRFRGPPVWFRSRLRGRLGRHVSFVLVADHDAGEPIAASGKVVDYVSASFTARDLGPVRHLVIGAMHPRVGLGLSLWGGQRMSRLTSTPGSFLRPSASVRASGSASEVLVLQGLGLELGLTSRFRIVGFVAQSTQDAYTDETGSVASLPASGLHRNHREASSDDGLHGTMMGGAIQASSSHVHIGVSYGAASTNVPIAPGDRQYQRFRHSGDRREGGTVYVAVRPSRRLDVAAEASFGGKGPPAGLVVARFRTGPGLSLFGAFRDYPPGFEGVLGAPPGASGASLGNEVGGTVGLEAKLASGRIALSRDVYREPWLQADSYRPSTNTSWGLHLEGEWSRARVLFKFDSRSSNRREASGVPESAPFSRRERLRVRAALAGSEALESIFDLVLVRYRRDLPETGHALGQRLLWNPKSGLSLTAGAVFFGSDSGNSGVYLFEPDLPDHFSIPLLSDGGQRVYILISAAFSKAISLSSKAAITKYDGERIIGAGVDRVVTSQVRTISFAMRIRV